MDGMWNTKETVSGTIRAEAVAHVREVMRAGSGEDGSRPELCVCSGTPFFQARQRQNRVDDLEGH